MKLKQLAVYGLIGALAGSAVFPFTAEAATKANQSGKVPAAKTAAKVVSATVPVAPPAAPDVAAEKSARITILDKQTNRRQVLVLLAGEPQTLGTIQVKLNKCMPDYAAVLGQDVAWLDITDGPEGSGRAAPWFSGWMFNTYPEVSTLDHPRYDVQLQGCGTKARAIVKATGSAPVLDTTAPAVDTETPDDESTGAEENDSGANASPSSDPYYVPGVEKTGGAAMPPAKNENAAPEVRPVVQPAEQGVPISGPVEATPPATQGAAVDQVPAPSDQNDLHKMMDNGTY